MYKMVVMDMDDTLLRDDHTISEGTKSVIEKAQQMGVKIVLASGRPTYAMKRYALELGLDKYNSHLISFNGANIVECTTENVIFKQSLSMENAHKLYDISKKYNLFIHTYLGDIIVTEENNEYTEIEKEITGMEINIVDNFVKAVNSDVIKVLMLEEPEKLRKAADIISKELADILSVTISKPFFLEFMDKGIDKAATLVRLINMLGIKKEEVIAIGDSYNDLSMIEFAGLGVSMSNGKPEVKAAADYITGSHMEDGIVTVFENFIFNNKNI